MGSYVLVLMLVAGFDENAVALEKVDGFTSLKQCQFAAKVYEDAQPLTAYRSRAVCLEVK